MVLNTHDTMNTFPELTLLDLNEHQNLCNSYIPLWGMVVLYTGIGEGGGGDSFMKECPQVSQRGVGVLWNVSMKEHPYHVYSDLMPSEVNIY